MKDKPLFFLHIPRTGGTTVDSILTCHFKKEEILKIYTKDEYEQNRFLDNDKLAAIKYITGHLLLETYDPPAIYGQDVCAFTFLREPVSRLISEYIFYKTWTNQHLFAYLNEYKVSFHDYLVSSDNLLKYRGKNFMTRCISGKGFTYNKTPLSALAFAKRQLAKNFYFVGITERFNESILLLGQQLQITNLLHNEHNKLNSTLKQEITPADCELAKELNQADISLYHFAQNLLQERIDKLGKKFQDDLQEFVALNEQYKKMHYSNNLNANNSIFLPK